MLRRSAVLLLFGIFHPENWTEERSGPVADWIHRTISLLFGAYSAYILGEESDLAMLQNECASMIAVCLC